jgi:hypothetical protein
MGRVGQESMTTMRQIEQQRNSVNQKFEDQKFQLEQSKNQAVNEANRDFQSKLLQISQSRAENEQAKAQARLSALQDLRNKVYQINLQNLQFQQTLQAQKVAQEQQLSSYGQSLGGSVLGAQNAVGSFNPNVESGLQTSTSGADASTNPYIGSINDDEELMGSINTGTRNNGLLGSMFNLFGNN